MLTDRSRIFPPTRKPKSLCTLASTIPVKVLLFEPAACALKPPPSETAGADLSPHAGKPRPPSRPPSALLQAGQWSSTADDKFSQSRLHPRPLRLEVRMLSVASAIADAL